MSPRAVLIGAPGAGKTTVGRRLAERWNVEFQDSDDAVEARAGKRIADIFIDEGEDAFRAMETAVLRDLLAHSDGVLSLGGGVVMRDENRELLQGHTLVWLEVSIPDAVRRVGLGASRPLLMGNVRGRLMELLAERTPVYASIATVRIDTSGRTPDEVALALEEQLREAAHG